MYKLLIILISLSPLYSQQENIPGKVVVESTSQFWIASKLAVTDSFYIRVSLPPDYSNSYTTRYPVLYLTDADTFWGAATDFRWFLHWRNPQIIIVGIGYGSRTAALKKRRGDFYYNPTPDGSIGAQKFITFFNDELIPEIESRYRVDNSNRTLFGWSAGATFALYTLFSQPQLFHNYLIGGNGPVTDDPLDRLERAYFENSKNLQAKVYAGIGIYDKYYPRLKNFIERIENRGYEGLQFKFETISTFTHSYEAGVALMAKGLQYVFHKPGIYLKFLQLVEEHGIDKAIETYHHLKTTSQEEYAFSESALNNAGYYLLNLGKTKAAQKIFELNIEENPQSANSCDSMADFYLQVGDKENALKFVYQTLETLEKFPHASTAIEKTQIQRWADEKFLTIKSMD
ncbi:MAG: hypothetical protein H6696_14800 [Deferribacteres bacterium]|nr:hypothetical protein [candidate division KSB1 bacterium]MCB9503197.1 hypothetical protein [Deferribacteres bacterium]